MQADCPPVMTYNRFWSLIETAKRNSDLFRKSQAELLRIELMELTTKEVVEFFDAFSSFMELLGHSKIRAAANEMLSRFCGETEFDAWRCWIISQGERKVREVWGNPSFLTGVGMPPAGCEDMLDVPIEVYMRKTGLAFEEVWNSCPTY